MTPDKLKHTAWPWLCENDHWGYELYRGKVGTHDHDVIVKHSDHWSNDSPSDDDDVLLKLAPTAPHHCSDPECPGDINRRKLEAFDRLLVRLQCWSVDPTIRTWSRALADDEIRRLAAGEEVPQ